MLYAERSSHSVCGIFAVVRQGQTYRNLLYLLTAFPLGTAYFVFLMTGLSVGASLIVVWVGVPILFLMAAGWWWLGAFERELAMWWLGVEIGPMARPTAGSWMSWPRLRAHLSNPVTWKSLLYLFAKFPIGIVTFVLTTLAIAGVFTLLATPFVYLYAVTQGAPVDGGRIAAVSGAALGGVALTILGLHVLNAIAWLNGQFARIMLGMTEAELRVAAAQAAAAQAQAQAARADQSRRELIVNVSHELRTPIASIRGHVDSLLMAQEMQAKTPEEQQAYLAIVAREAERLGSLVDDLMALARADADELKLTLEPVDAAGVVAEAQSALAPIAKSDRHVTLVSQSAPDLPPVMADRARLAQVLLNLTRNAILYTPAGGIVSLEVARADQGHIAISVADTGIGIPPEDLDHIFERFYRTDASRARSSGGFGLGLAIVRDLVQAMGGTVAVTSRVNEGSRFVVTLRVAATNPAPTAH